jgi:sugar lactone lactonase YvrE
MNSTMRKKTIAFFSIAGLFIHGLASTGDIEKKVPAPSSCLTGLAYDGKNIWGVDRKSDKIYRVDPSDGQVTQEFMSPGYFSTGLAWDGKYLWVADVDFTSTSYELYSGKVYQVDPETGKTIHFIMAPGKSPQGLAWDGEYLWVSDNEDDMIYCISPGDGTVIHSFKSPANDPGGLTWDGDYLWVGDHAENKIYRVHPEKGIVVLVIDSPGPYPWGLAWQGDKLWVTDYQDDEIYALEIFSEEPYRRTNERFAEVEFTSDLINFGPGTITALDLYLAEPVNRSSQEVLEISYAEQPDGFYTDKWDQRVAHFNESVVTAGERIITRMKVKAKIYEVTYNIFPEKVGLLIDIPADISARYLQDDEKYQLNDPVIKEAVTSVTAGQTNPYWISRDIFDYLREKLVYKRTGGWDIAPTVLKRGSGSCSEYAFVYIALCRAAGVPARYVGSVVVRGEEASFDYVYHRWVEVYLPGYGWIPVDPSGGDQELPADQADYFGHLSNRFLITTVGGGNSEYLGWDYNSSQKWEADGPVQLREEKIAEWNPLEEKGK